MSILGHPTNGWFAKLAHGVESVGRFFGLGGVYNRMETHAGRYAGNVNQAAIQHATQSNATQQQALQAGSAAMDRLANPASMGDIAQLTGAGGQVATQATGEAIRDTLNPFAGIDWGMLALIGGGIAAAAIAVPSLLPGSGTSRRRNSSLA